MKTWKLFWVFVFVGVMSSGFLTACGKGGDDGGSNSNLTYGSLTSDGQSVTSANSTLAGMPFSMSIANINRYGYGYAGNPCSGYGGYNPGGYGQAGVTYTLAINGQYGQQMQATSQDSGFQMFGGGYGNMYVDTAMLCYDSSCNTVLLGVIVASSGNGYGGNNYEYKQVAVRKNMSSNQIETVREFQGGAAQMVSLCSLISQM